MISATSVGGNSRSKLIEIISAAANAPIVVIRSANSGREFWVENMSIADIIRMT
jgi:hypothetical protein